MTHLVEVGVGEDGDLLLDGLEQPDGDVEAGVGAVRELRGALHGAEGAAGLGGAVEGTRRVPPADGERERTDQIGGRARLVGREGKGDRGRMGGFLREAEHEGRAVLLGDEAAELAPGLGDGGQVLIADVRVALGGHG